MTHSEQINEIAAALSKAQAVIEGAKKDSANPFFKSTYADLASVWDACRKPLTDHGLSVAQTAATDEGGVGITTILMHASGQWLRDTLVMKPVKDDPQGVGSCITYARRYALAAMVGVAPEDDDGNAASARNGASKPTAVAAKVSKPEGYDKWLDEFRLVADEGYERIAAAFKGSKKEYRDYLTGTDSAVYEKLKKVAVAVDERAKVSA
jgi:hypothetical protein